MKEREPFCFKPWDNLLVEVNGDCYFCCFIIRPGGKIGNLKKGAALEEIWTSRKAGRIRNEILRGKIPYTCQLCPYFGEFKPEKYVLYKIYFTAHKIKDAFVDFVQGGFTRDKVRRVFKRRRRVSRN